VKVLFAACSCVYCLWGRALGKALVEKMDHEIMEEYREENSTDD
jgi:hypothetical protein